MHIWDVDAFAAACPAGLWLRWRAFDALEPFGDLNDWKRTSLQVSTQMNTVPFRKPGAPVIGPNQFVPPHLLPEGQRPAPRRPPSWQAQKAALKAFVAAGGGAVVTECKNPPPPGVGSAG